MKRVIALALMLASIAMASNDNSFNDWRRACAYLHNESCSEFNPVPGPCTARIDCVRHVCTPGNEGSCADDPSLSWCDGVDCDEVAHLVRQQTNPLGRMSGANTPSRGAFE